MKFFLRSIPGRTVLALLVFTILWTLVEHVLGFNTSRHDIGQYSRLFTAIVFYAAIVIAIIKKRQQQNGVLGFAEGFRTGLAITLIYSLLITLWFAFYAEVINPSYKSSLMEFERKKITSSGASAEEITSKMNEVDMSSGGSFTSYLLLFAFMATAGLIVSLIAAIVLKRQPEQAPNGGLTVS
jgi:hypothetical protein